MVFPSLVRTRVNLKITRHLVEEELAASQCPDVTLYLTIRNYPQARFLKQMCKLVANREVGNACPALDVQPDTEILRYGVPIQPPLSRDTYCDPTFNEFRKFGVGTFNLALQFGRYFTEQRSGQN
jgi:hypothetical protein